MARIRRVLLALALLALVLATPAVRAQPPCTVFISPGQALPPWLAPGAVLCLHKGDYPHDLVRITTNSATYQAAPGEQARLVATGGASLEVYGHDVTLSGLEIDNGGAGAPALVLRGANDTVTGSDIHNGSYNGVDVRGQSDTITGSTIHDFNSGVAQSDAQCVNLISNNLAGSPGGFRLLGNTIWNCSGDGVQAYHANVLPCPVDVPPGIIAGNVFSAGTLAFEENAFDLKWGSWRVVSNTVSGYGFVGQTGTTDTSPAGFVHKCSYDVLVSGNLFDHNGKGVEVFGASGLDAGTNPVSITVSGNTFTFNGPGYLTNVVGGVRIIVAPNLIFPNGLPTATATATRSATSTVPSQTATQPPTATATATRTASPTVTVTTTATPVRHVICYFWDGRVTLDCD